MGPLVKTGSGGSPRRNHRFGKGNSFQRIGWGHPADEFPKMWSDGASDSLQTHRLAVAFGNTPMPSGKMMSLFKEFLYIYIIYLTKKCSFIP